MGISINCSDSICFSRWKIYTWFYFQMSEYWRELVEIETSSESTVNVFTSTRTGESKRLHQFLMALCSKFSTLAGQLIHWDLIPSLDSTLSNLISEETRLRSIVSRNTVPIESVLVVASRSRSILVCGHCHKKDMLLMIILLYIMISWKNIGKRFVKDGYKLYSPIHQLIS